MTEPWGMPAEEIETLRQDVRAWYRGFGRVLPWREDRRDPYRVLVSETMLVQTTVSAVIPYYHRFLERFPTLVSLADAPEADVLKQWEGLGYYRRARQLHALARTVRDDFGGAIPADEASLRALPGVGRYIAGAIRSFAFGLPAPILEANTIRLMARLTGLEEDVSKGSAQKRLWAAAGELVPDDDPGTFNQALMDLGAVVCTPAQPRCTQCPLEPFCVARRKGLTGTIPVRPARTPPSPGEEVAMVVSRPADGAILMVRRPATGLWATFWELPTLWIAGADPAGRAAAGAAPRPGEDPAKAVGRLFGIEVMGDDGVPPRPMSYVVTRYKMTLRLIRGQALADIEKGQPGCPPGWSQAKFVTTGEMHGLTMPAAHRKALERMGLARIQERT